MPITTDSGIANPIAGVLNIVGGSNITTSAAGNAVTINLIASPSIAGSWSATQYTINTGHLTISAGNIDLSAGQIAQPASNTTLFKYLDNHQLRLAISGFNVVGASYNINIGAGGVTDAAFSGSYNVGIGTSVLQLATSGSYNTGSGQACYALLTNGSFNTSIGRSGFASLTTGSFNASFGYNVGTAITTGSYNILCGGTTGNSLTLNDSSNVAIVNDPLAAGFSHLLRFGVNGVIVNRQNKCYIAGIYNAAVGVVNSPVIIDSTHFLGTVVSSIRFKENIKPMGDVSSPINKLRPVTFTYKHDEPKVRCFGLIAEEVHEVMPELVMYDDAGQPYSVGYHRLPTLILNEMIKRAKVIESIKERIATLKTKLRSA